MREVGIPPVDSPVEHAVPHPRKSLRWQVPLLLALGVLLLAFCGWGPLGRWKPNLQVRWLHYRLVHETSQHSICWYEEWYRAQGEAGALDLIEIIHSPESSSDTRRMAVCVYAGAAPNQEEAIRELRSLLHDSDTGVSGCAAAGLCNNMPHRVALRVFVEEFGLMTTEQRSGVVVCILALFGDDTMDALTTLIHIDSDWDRIAWQSVSGELSRHVRDQGMLPALLTNRDFTEEECSKTRQWLMTFDDHYRVDSRNSPGMNWSIIPR